MVLMLWRNSRGRPSNKPAGFILPCRPTVAAQPPSGAGWVHELKHDGYRLQIHVRDGRVKLYTMNAADWSKRYPRIVEEAARIKGHAIIDAEVVCLDSKGVAQFDLLHNRSNDGAALALAFDLLALNGKDLRKHPLVERKTALSKLLIRSKGDIQYVEHAVGHGDPTVIGTVTLTDTAAGVDFSLSPSAGYLINLAGNGHTTFSFSTNVALTPASFTNLTAGFVPVLPNLNQNGFGDFTAGVTDNGSIGNTFAGPLTFTVLGIDFSNFTQSANGAESVSSLPISSDW